MPGNVWDIVEEVLVRINAINGVAPYLRTVGGVYLTRKIEEEIPQTEKPAIAVIIGGETSVDYVGLKTTDFIITFTMQIFCAADTDLGAIHEVLDLGEDISNAMLTEGFFVGDAYDATHLQTGAPIAYPIDDKHAGGDSIPDYEER